MLRPELHVAAIQAFLSCHDSDAVRLRLAGKDDAAFLLSLRLDPSRNKNLSATSNDIAAQIGWMEKYVERHNKGEEAYFVISVDGKDAGTLRIYDYQHLNDSFCWGSWIIAPGAPPAVAYQSVVLVYDLAFGALKFAKSHFDVRQANTSVWRFHEKMGARLVRQDSLDRFYEYTKEDYVLARKRLEKFSQGHAFP